MFCCLPIVCLFSLTLSLRPNSEVPAAPAAAIATAAAAAVRRPNPRFVEAFLAAEHGAVGDSPFPLHASSAAAPVAHSMLQQPHPHQRMPLQQQQQQQQQQPQQQQPYTHLAGAGVPQAKVSVSTSCILYLCVICLLPCTARRFRWFSFAYALN